jgi:hypothetical protein
MEVVPDVGSGQVDRLLAGGVAGRSREVARVGRRNPQRPGGGDLSGRVRSAGGHDLVLPHAGFPRLSVYRGSLTLRPAGRAGGRRRLLVCYPRPTLLSEAICPRGRHKPRTSFVPTPASGADVRAPTGTCGARPTPNGVSFPLACNLLQPCGQPARDRKLLCRAGRPLGLGRGAGCPRHHHAPPHPGPHPARRARRP